MSLNINRTQVWAELDQQDWDVIVIGGGITGAGILREAIRAGYKTLLVEQRDFAWGTSSRSSKMVHGGLRYLAAGDVKLTWHSLRERERLVAEAPGLIQRIGYYLPMPEGKRAKRLQYMLGMRAYEAMARTHDARYVPKSELLERFPGVRTDGIDGACYYTDTLTDDARLVLRVISDALAAAQPGQAVALNYAEVQDLGVQDGMVRSLSLRDGVSGQTANLSAKAVINATGSWADRLRGKLRDEKRIRPLRGSHLVFDRAQLPVDEVLIFPHPQDKRHVYIYPWDGATVVGTTDLDHEDDLNHEARITQAEVDYLMRSVTDLYPGLGLTAADIVSTWAGVRPVIGAQNSRDPSKERRDHAVWQDGNLITIAGGKLTTFRLMARDALVAASAHLPAANPAPGDDGRVFSSTGTESDATRLGGRYGAALPALLAQTRESETAPIRETQYTLAECRWAAGHEGVVHLDDLMLRRTRLGNLLPDGGAEIMPALQQIFAQEQGWDDARWAEEQARYDAIWRSCYSLPG